MEGLLKVLRKRNARLEYKMLSLGVQNVKSHNFDDCYFGYYSGTVITNVYIWTLKNLLYNNSFMNQLKRLCIDNICMSSRIHIELVFHKQIYQTRVKCIWKWRHLNIPLKYLKSLVKSFFNSLKLNYCFACNLKIPTY